jgi:Mor family transcriptional regulator
MPDKKTFVPVKDLADKRKCTVQHIYRLIREGKLESKKIGTYTLVRS